MSIEEARERNLEKMIKLAGLTREEREEMYQQTEKDFRRRFADHSRHGPTSADSNIRLVENLRTFFNSLRPLISTSNDYRFDILNIVMMYALNGFDIDTRLHYLEEEMGRLNLQREVDLKAWKVQYEIMCEGFPYMGPSYNELRKISKATPMDEEMARKVTRKLLR